MRRREFIAALGGAAALPLAARAQRVIDRVPTVGVLFSLTESDPEAKSRAAAFQQGLQALGWIVGRNIRINYRFAATSEPERIKAHATALIDDTPDVLVASGTPVMAVLHQQVSSIPIVFAQVADPISQGFVKSLSNPGDNITGFTAFDFSIGGKWLELLKEIAPSVTRVGFVQSPDDPMLRRLFPILETLALSLQVQLTRVDVRDLQQIELGIVAFARQANAALIVPPTTLTYIYSQSHHGDAVSTACRLSLPQLRHGWWSSLLRHEHCGPISASGILRRPHSQGGEAGRPPGAAADQVRACNQPQDRQGARPRPCRLRCSPAPTR